MAAGRLSVFVFLIHRSPEWFLYRNAVNPTTLCYHVKLGMVVLSFSLHLSHAAITVTLMVIICVTTMRCK